MDNYIKKKSIIVSFMIMLSVISFCILPVLSKAADSKPLKKSFWVEFIDVGQGDCALIQCDGKYMMIDGGPSKASSIVYTILKEKGINTLDVMVATHPDEDHIGGLSGALNYAKVEKVYSPVISHDTKTFKSLLKYINKQGKKITVPKAGDSFSLGSAKVNILGPLNTSEDTNNSSIVVKVTYGKNTFLFMGDAEEKEELHIIKNNKDIKCDVIKIGHHGSISSTSKALLNASNPTYAVISVGKNKYGHPADKIIEKLSAADVQIYRTDKCGDITFYSDGNEISVETEKNTVSNTYKPDSENSSSKTDTNGVISTGNDTKTNESSYVLNTNTKKFHIPTCSSVSEMKEKNKQYVSKSREDIISDGYKPCKKCNP